jgi:hypothetical protein
MTMNYEEGESNIEPQPDPELSAALRDAFEAQPGDTDWAALRARTLAAAAFRLRGRARVPPWWEQATPLARRLLPLGALAAAAAVALMMVTPRPARVSAAAQSTAYAADPIAGIGDRIADAIVAPNGSGVMQQVAGPVDDEWLWDATAAAHAAEHR